MKSKRTLMRGGQEMQSSALKEPATKAERLEARLSPEAKALCRKAAILQGRTLTDFVVTSAVEAAARTVREHEVVDLSRHDRIAFVEALLNPPSPHPRLQKAMQRHDRLVRQQ